MATPRDHERERHICELYRDGKTIGQIGAELHCDPKTAWLALKRHGIEIRPQAKNFIHKGCADGHSTPTYKIWAGIRSRCGKVPGYEQVRLCERWSGRHGYNRFLEDMGERPGGMSIDRINPAGDYEPSNCRWADDKTQARNTRDAVYIDALGVRLMLCEWAERTGLHKSVIWNRIHRSGWTPTEAVSQPLVRGYRRRPAPVGSLHLEAPEGFEDIDAGRRREDPASIEPGL